MSYIKMYRQAIGKKGNRKGRKREGKTEHREEKGIGKVDGGREDKEDRA